MLSPDTQHEIEAFFKTLVEKYTLKRRDEDRQAIISSTNPITLDYREHRYLYIFSPTAFSLQVQDYGTFNLPASTWVPLPFPERTRLFAPALAPDQVVFLRATDDVIPYSGSGSGGPASAVNVAQFGGVNTQMGTSAAVPIGNSPVVEVGLYDGGTNFNLWKAANGDNIGSNYVAAVTQMYYSPGGLNPERVRGPNTFKTVTTAATGNTALWTPAAGKKFRLMRWFIQITDNAAAASAGVLEVTFQDSASAMPFGFSVFVPSAAGTVIGAELSTPWIDLGNGFLSAAANNVLNLNLSFALTAGEVRAMAIGTEE